MSELRSQRLRKRYKSRTVVQDVSLEVSSGEVVGLLGPNGAGKTTCFYMIVGLVPADGGAIVLDGADITALPMHARPRRGVRYLPNGAITDSIVMRSRSGTVRRIEASHALDKLELFTGREYG